MHNLSRFSYFQLIFSDICIPWTSLLETYVPLNCEEDQCINVREFDLEGGLVGVPHTWYLSAPSFITLLKLV